jgi:hypothetical protein
MVSGAFTVTATNAHGDIGLDAKVFVAHLPAFPGFFNDNGVQGVGMRAVIDHIPDKSISFGGADIYQFLEFKRNHG